MNKTVLITGASAGIGASTANMLARSGWRVVINYNHSEKEASDLCKNIRSSGGDALAVKADVSLRCEVEDMFAVINKEFGGVDALVNNAGISKISLFSDVTEEEWQRMIGVNLTGAFNCIQMALPHMINRKSGAIVNISSIWGLVGASCEVAYSATKSGLIGMTKALAKELGPSGIRVNCVAPGVIATRMNADLDDATLSSLKEETPLMRIGTPEDIACTVRYLLSEDASFVTGQVISPNGGFTI